MAIDVIIPDEQMARLAERLNPRQLHQATYQIVKRTTAQVVKRIRNEVRSQVDISKKWVDRVVSQVNPSGEPPVGKVIVKKMPIPLIAFKVRALKHGGVSVRIGKGRPPLVLHHAFVATMPTGHEGVYLRSRHLPTKGPNSGKLNKHGKPLLKLTAQGFAGRLAIDEQFGPSIYKLLTIPAVLKQITFDSNAYMAQQAQSQLDRFTKGQPADTTE